MDKLYNRKLLLEKWPISPEDMFLELIDDYKIIIQKNGLTSLYNFSSDKILYYFKGDEILFEYNKTVNLLNCNYKLYWSIFAIEYRFNDIEIKKITKDMIGKYLNLGNLRFISYFLSE